MNFENEQLSLEKAIGIYGESWWAKIKEIY